MWCLPLIWLAKLVLINMMCWVTVKHLIRVRLSKAKKLI